MYVLRPKEEEIMDILWSIEKGFLKEILPRLKEPAHPSNTVLSIIRKLEREGFVNHHIFGKSHQYYPVITKKQYNKAIFKSVFKKQFDNSPQALFSFFIKEENVKISDLEALLELLKSEQK